MPAYFTLLTTIGKAKIANAILLNEPVAWTHMAVGDGSGSPTTPNQAQTALVNERYRATINQLTTDPDNASYIISELIIPTAVGGWQVNEVGIFDADGDLIAVANFPATYKPTLAEGSGRDLVVRIVVEVANTSAVTLQVNPAITLASQAWVAANYLLRSKVTGGTTGQVLAKSSNTNEAFVWADPKALVGDATTEAKGIVQLATGEEIKTATNNTKAVTPKGLSDADFARLDLVQTWLKAQGSDVVALAMPEAPETAVAIDLDASNVFMIEPDESFVLDNPDNVVNGRPFAIIIVQPVAGGAGMGFESDWVFENDDPPENTTTPGAIDVLFGMGLPDGKVFAHLKQNIS